MCIGETLWIKVPVFQWTSLTSSHLEIRNNIVNVLNSTLFTNIHFPKCVNLFGLGAVCYWASVEAMLLGRKFELLRCILEPQEVTMQDKEQPLSELKDLLIICW